MNSNPDSGIENTRGESATKKWPMGWMRSFREKISSNRLVAKSWSLPIQSQRTLRRQLNSEEPLTPEPANQQVNSPADQIRSDQLDPRSYEEVRNNWAEQLNHLRQTEEPESVVLQNDSDNHSNIPEPLIGDNTRDVLSYNQLLEQARAILDSSETPETNINLREDPTNLVEIDFSNEGVDRSYFCTQFLHTRITEVPVDDLIFELQYLRKLNQRTDISNTEIESALRALLLTEPNIITPFELFSHCQLKTNYEPPTESEYESVVSEREELIEKNSNLLPILDQETELIPDDRLVTIPVSGQADLVISTTSAPITPSNPTLPSAIEKTSTDTPSPFTSTPISHQPKLPSRRVTFPPIGTTAQGGNSPTAGMSAGGKKPDIPVIIYAGELSRLLESGMSYEDASVAADQIVKHVMDSRKCSPISIPGAIPRDSPKQINQPTPLGETPVRTLGTSFVPFFTHLTGQSGQINPVQNIPKQIPDKFIPRQGLNATFPLPITTPQSIGAINKTRFDETSNLDKNRKLLQGQAMTLFSNVGIYIDRDRSGRFDEWLAHLESVLILGDFEESRKIALLRSKLYGEAADEFDNFKIENPIRAQDYDKIKERLHKLFHSTETRSKQSVEFHNMQREPEENMRRYANRIRKAFNLAYPMTSIIDKATSHSREQIMMDRFLEGLSFDVQTRLKYKEFPSFEKLIEKAEMTAMAVEESQVRNRLNAFQSRNVESNREFDRITEALERLNTKVESNTHQNDLEKRIEKMQRQLTAQKSVSFSQNIPQIYRPPNKTANLYFCDFHNGWGNHETSRCKTKEGQVDRTCYRCKKTGHLATYCPEIKNGKPSPPPGYDANGVRQGSTEQREN